jgi:hypothetical protein
LAHERELREVAQQSLDKALELQAAEVERRLQVLNGEYARIDKVLAGTVPRELYQQAHEVLKQRIDALEDAGIARTTREQERDRSTVRTMALIGLAASVGGFLMSLLARLLGLG